MLELEDAQSRILAALRAPLTERVSLTDAHRRVAAESVDSPRDLPLFDNSAVDGYAVRSSDVTEASRQSPVRLQLVGRVVAGDYFNRDLAAGQCVRLFTGSPVPRGADAVVMQEDTRVEPARPDEVTILDTAKAWENVRFHGEDLKRGGRLISAGESVTIGRVALLAAVGVAELNVSRRPIVGLLATGSELKTAGETLGPGQIYESNRIGLAPLINSAGGVVRSYPIVVDALDLTAAALKKRSTNATW